MLGRVTLRGRVMLAYGLLALGLSSVLAIVTWSVVSDYLTQQRESSAVTVTEDNAAALRYGRFGPPEPCPPVRERVECPSPALQPGVSPMQVMNSGTTAPSTSPNRPTAAPGSSSSCRRKPADGSCPPSITWGVWLLASVSSWRTRIHG